MNDNEGMFFIIPACFNGILAGILFVIGMVGDSVMSWAHTGDYLIGFAIGLIIGFLLSAGLDQVIPLIGPMVLSGIWLVALFRYIF